VVDEEIEHCHEAVPPRLGTDWSRNGPSLAMRMRGLGLHGLRRELAAFGPKWRQVASLIEGVPRVESLGLVTRLRFGRLRTDCALIEIDLKRPPTTRSASLWLRQLAARGSAPASVDRDVAETPIAREACASHDC
jgi:hypothetical protein